VPAKTVNQLYGYHSTYLEAPVTPEKFRDALNEVMPRIYKMGYWREMLMEHTQDASDGYVSLPLDTDSVVVGILDNNPLAPYSLWHDYKIYGTRDDDKTDLNAFIDDGYASTYRDIETAYAYQFELQAIQDDNSSLPTDNFSVKIRYRGSNTGAGFAVFNLNQTTTADTGSGVNVSSIDEIIYNDIPDGYSIRVIADPFDDSFDAVTLADLSSGSGVVRYRRFRIGGTDSSSSAHLLLKRRWEEVDGSDDVVYVPESAIVKHALLGKLSEDNADIQRAEYHWGVVAKLLEVDTDSFRGTTRPVLKVNPAGGGHATSGMY
tara:strand:- start:8815 stop:9771 length:957 start_codon:yes stop_codon:yes gene_type:complete